ncbi:MAG: histidine phosphatase family protein [Sciscionella sp.]
MRTSNSRAEYPQVRFQPPAGSCELLLIRHGESARAVDGVPFPLVDGQSDPELSPTGRRQADRIADRLGGENLDAIYVTPLRRTAQTAAPLCARLGITPVVEPELREVHLGEWEGGVYRKMVVENHPAVQRMHSEQRWDVIPGAEPAQHLQARVRNALLRLAAAHAGQRLAVFTHGGVIGQAFALAGESRPFAFLGADNGSISQLVIAETTWVIRRFNDTAHLDPTFSIAAAPLT